MYVSLRFLVLFVFITSVFAASFAYAGQPRLLQRYGDWEAYVFFENGQKVCYMASQPKNKQGNYTKRGEPFALVTHRPSESTRDVFSYITGYTYKAGSEALAIIDDEKFKLYTQNETAWGPDTQIDKMLAKAIKNGSKMIVKGVSSRGTETTDTLSLKGSSAAYKRISAECG